MKVGLAWAQVALGIVRLAEAILPAVMIVWNERLRHKIKYLQDEITIMRMDDAIRQGKKAIRRRHDGKDDVEILNEYLAKRGSAIRTYRKRKSDETR